jgi:hypothetical protein
MFELGWKLALCVLTALLLAGRSVRVAMRREPGVIRNGPWEIHLGNTTATASMYSRAYFARRAPFALSAPEAIYFYAETDSLGNPLKGDKTYRIEGRDQETRWWNLTVYSNYRVIPNPLNRYSFAKDRISRRDDGSWNIFLSPQEQPENWLPSSNSQSKLRLVLRCYVPDPELLRDPAGASLPKITQDYQ